MSVALMKNAAYIVHGYVEVKCLRRECPTMIWIEKCKSPYSEHGLCDSCRIELKDKESVEVYAEDDLTFLDDEEEGDERD